MASPQVVVLAAVLFLAMAVDYSSANWCVCKDGLSDAVLQKTLDYACGNGADCSPVRPNGVCYNPNTVRAHCSYAVNSYYQKKSGSGATCDFGGTATLTASNPSNSGCSFPASGSAAGSSSTTPATTVPSTSPTTPTSTPVTTTPVSGTPTTSSPYTAAPSTGSTTPSTSTSPYMGGISNGIAPTGVGMNDNSQAGRTRLQSTATALCLIPIGLVLLIWN